MKICTVCKTEREFSDFYRNKLRKDGYNSQCKSCADVSNKKSRHKHLEKTRQHRRNARDRSRAIVNEYKSSRGCQVCGENRHPHVLDLHHTDPSVKEDAPANLRWSRKRFLAEAEKCVVLCANCHRLHHAGVLDL